MVFEQLMGESSGIESLPLVKMNFSIATKPEVVEVPTPSNFSEDPVASVNDYVNKCFSLLERIKQASMPPKLVIKKRLNEVTKYCNANSLENIKANKKIIIRYLSEYVYQTIMDCITDPNITKINLALILGLNSLVAELDSTGPLQSALKRAKRELTTKGVISKELQKELSSSYVKFWTELLIGIEDKYLKEEKKGALVNRPKGIGVLHD